MLAPRSRSRGSSPASLRSPIRRSLGHLIRTARPRASSSRANPTATARPRAAGVSACSGQGRAALSHTPPGGELQGRPCWPWPRLWRSASTTRGGEAPASSRRSSSVSVLLHCRKRWIRHGWGGGRGLVALPARALGSETPGGCGSGRWASCRLAAATAPFKAPSASCPCGGHQLPARRWDGPGPAGPSPRRRRQSRCPG
ncbi:MAG: hypothetical protein RLZZ374_1019 [Cyanobacteriota bacterium]